MFSRIKNPGGYFSKRLFPFDNQLHSRPNWFFTDLENFFGPLTIDLQVIQTVFQSDRLFMFIFIPNLKTKSKCLTHFYFWRQDLKSGNMKLFCLQPKMAQYLRMPCLQQGPAAMFDDGIRFLTDALPFLRQADHEFRDDLWLYHSGCSPHFFSPIPKDHFSSFPGWAVWETDLFSKQEWPWPRAIAGGCLRWPAA